MKLTMLMENTACSEEIDTEHGLSIYIETKKHKILFDTGQSDRFIANAEKLGIDLQAVDLAIISHGHYDHGGGLTAFLAINSTAPVYIDKDAFAPHFSASGRDIGLDPKLEASGRIIFTEDTLIIDEELELRSAKTMPDSYPTDSYGLNMLEDGKLTPDDFRHEQYLLIHQEDQLVLISGCSHKNILNILHWIRPKHPDVVVGGFHLMTLDPKGEDRFILNTTAAVLANYNPRSYPCHCTGIEQYEYLKQTMGQKLSYLSAGEEVII